MRLDQTSNATDQHCTKKKCLVPLIAWVDLLPRTELSDVKPGDAQ